MVSEQLKEEFNLRLVNTGVNLVVAVGLIFYIGVAHNRLDVLTDLVAKHEQAISARAERIVRLEVRVESLANSIRALVLELKEQRRYSGQSSRE